MISIAWRTSHKREGRPDTVILSFGEITEKNKTRYLFHFNFEDAIRIFGKEIEKIVKDDKIYQVNLSLNKVKEWN